MSRATNLIIVKPHAAGQPTAVRSPLYARPSRDLSGDRGAARDRSHGDARRGTHGTGHPPAERLAEGRVAGQRGVLQPQAVDDERAGRAVELRVEPAHEPVAPQDRHRVVAEAALLDRLVDLPDVVEAEQRLRPAARADRVERRQEGGFVVGGRRRAVPSRRASGPPRASSISAGIGTERELGRPPALDPDLDRGRRRRASARATRPARPRADLAPEEAADAGEAASGRRRRSALRSRTSSASSASTSRRASAGATASVRA